MIYITPMFICPCNPTSARSRSTSLLYHSTSGAISTSSTSDQSSPFFYILTTTATNTTSASAWVQLLSMLLSLQHYILSIIHLVLVCVSIEISSQPKFLSKWNVKNNIRVGSLWVRIAESSKLFIKLLTQFLFSCFPTSETIMANFTQSISTSVTDSKVSSQSQNISASVSLTPSPALSLTRSASAVAELTSQVDFVSSSSSTYLSQDASSSMGESLTFFPWVSRFSFNK